MTSALRMIRQATEPAQPPTNRTDIFIDTDGDLAYKRADGSVGKLKGGGAINLAGYDLTLGADSTLAGSLTGGGAVTIATGQTAAFARGGVPMLRGSNPVQGRIPYMSSNTDVLDAAADLSYNTSTGVVTAVKLASTNALVAPGMKPAADSTTAIQLQNAAGTAVLTVDTTNQLSIGAFGIGNASAKLFRYAAGVIRQKIDQTTLADNGVLVVSDSSLGMVLMFNLTDGPVGLYMVTGAAGNVIYGHGTISGTKDNAGTINIYAESGQIKVQNKRGSTKTLAVVVTGG